MSKSARAYEAPALQHCGEIVVTTKHNLTKNIEADMSPQSVFGAVGFGV
ncbi:MAG: hypothetical protein ACREND_15915 [Gemmatimonadaceae bacterium]